MFALAATVAALDEGFETDFSSRDADHFALETACSHCKHKAWQLRSPHPDECTQNTEEAVSFGKEGATIHTSRLSETTECGADCESGHIEFTPWLTFGKFTARATWFPEASNSSATGFMGLDANNNLQSITFGFHGKDWQKYDGSHKFQTGIYANVSLSHNQEVIDSGVDLAEEHEFSIHWHKDKVLWRIDGRTVRKELDASVVPQLPMKLRLHSRSGYCSQLSAGQSFTSRFSYFSYEPYSEDEPVVV